MLLVLFPAVQTKTMVTGSLWPISNVACKGPFCVKVLTSFYMVGSSLKKDKLSTPHRPSTRAAMFFYSLTPPRFRALNRESESSGSQSVYRKLFPRGPHSSKNNFFGIKISRPTPWVSLSVLLWLLEMIISISWIMNIPLNMCHVEPWSHIHWFHGPWKF